MSLIHEALRSLNAPESPAPGVPLRRSIPGGVNKPAWLYAICAFVVVMAAGWLAWALWQGMLPTIVTGAPAGRAFGMTRVAAGQQPISVSDVQQAPAEAAVRPQETSAPRAVPRGVDSSLNGQSVTIPVLPVSPSRAAVAQKPTVKLPTAVPQEQGQAQTKPDTEPTVQGIAHPERVDPAAGETAAIATPAAAPDPLEDEEPIELLFARFVASMRVNQKEEAAHTLALLERRLPQGSLVLLRAQAWAHLSSGRDAQAAHLYRTVLERMPGDEGAAINLASILSRSRQQEEARSILADAVRLRPDSTALRAALDQFTPNVRR